METEYSPYSLDNRALVPPEHRLFFHEARGKHYVYGCNFAYECDSVFQPLAIIGVRFPFHATKSTWFFHCACKAGALVLGVVNRSLFLLSELLIYKLCDTPVYRGYNPLIFADGKLLFLGQDGLYYFSRLTLQFTEVPGPKLHSQLCFHRYYYDDLEQKIVEFGAERAFPCPQLVFAFGNLALCLNSRSKRGCKYSLIDLAEGKVHWMDSECGIDGEVVFSFAAKRGCIILEQAGLFVDFDDQFWYQQELALLYQPAVEFEAQHAHFWAQNLCFLQKLEDQAHKACLYLRRLKGPQAAAAYRKQALEELRALRAEVDVVANSAPWAYIY